MGNRYDDYARNKRNRSERIKPMTEKQKKCLHLKFKGNMKVNRLEDTGQYWLERWSE